MRALAFLVTPFFLFAWLCDKGYILNHDSPPLSMVDEMALIILGAIVFHLYIVGLFVCIWYDVKNEK